MNVPTVARIRNRSVHEFGGDLSRRVFDRKRSVGAMDLDLAGKFGDRNRPVQASERERTAMRCVNDEVRHPLTLVRTVHCKATALEGGFYQLELALGCHAIVRESSFAVQDAEIRPIPAIDVDSS